MKRLKGILFIVVIFLCGVFVGAAIGGTAAMMDLVNKTFRGGPPNIRKILVKRAKHDFKLDEDQTHQFWQIITDAGSEMHQAVKPVPPPDRRRPRECFPADERSAAAVAAGAF